MQRELLILGFALVLGFVVMPVVIFGIGSAVMGPYAGGKSVIALYGKFFKALAQGWPSFWLVAVGPYVLISLLRLLIALLFGRSNDAESSENRAPPKRRAPAAGSEPRPSQQPTRRAPTLSEDGRTPVGEARRPAAPPPSRAPSAPAQPTTQPARKSPPKPGERRTPFIKSID